MKAKYHTPESLRAELKAELGYNSRQVTVSKEHSNTYLKITVRDPKVSLPAVEAFAKARHTWTMDVTDYCTGQSVHVATTNEVDAAHAAPWMSTVEALLPELDAMEEETCLSLDAIRPGLFVWLDRRDFRVELNRERRCYRSKSAVMTRESWVIQALAMDIARLLEDHPLDGLPEIPVVAPVAEIPAPVAPVDAPEPENVIQFARPTPPAEIAPERPAYQDKPRHYSQQSLFATDGLFQLR